jgi:hypothetical protein
MAKAGRDPFRVALSRDDMDIRKLADEAFKKTGAPSYKFVLRYKSYKASGIKHEK